MKLEIEYIQIANCINVLDKLSLKGLKSIHRTRLSKKLSEILQRVGDEQRSIHLEYFEADENGEPIVEDEKCKDVKGYRDTMDKFLVEKAVVDDGDSQVMLKSVQKSLEESEIDWEGREAYTFEYLYTALDSDEDKDKTERETKE